MQMDLELSWALMNGAWPDLELLPVEERPLARQTTELTLKVVPSDFMLISLPWDVPLLFSLC